MTKALTFVEVDLPLFTPTVIHLKFDDAVNSPQTTTDSNTEGLDNVWTFSGDVNLDVVPQIMFGTGQLHCGGSTGFISTPDRPEFNLSNGDFSFEFYFVNNTPIGTAKDICGQRLGVGGPSTTSSFNIFISSTGKLTAKVFVGSLGHTVTSTSAFSNDGVAHHVSFNRHGGRLLLFIDGVLEDTDVILASEVVNDISAPFTIGRDGDDTSTHFDGYIDEFSLSHSARRSANFTPPSTNFPASATAALPSSQTFRFAIDAGYLPPDIEVVPSMREVRIDPAIISLGEDLGTRATVTATFRDHRHVFIAEAFDSGSFWGKFRARYGLKLRGYPLRVINGSLGQSLVDMETRHFVIESTDGPSLSGEYKIVAKDILKFADGDRSQAPVPSNGFLVANITNVATSATLSPTGIGNLEYPSSGLVAIGGTEICSFTRSGDVLTLTRAQKNTAGVAHNAQDRVQLVLQYTAQDAGTIIQDLLINYAGVSSSYIILANWQLELSTYLNTVYTATIAEPTSVNKLISELIEQVGLVMWWDAVNQQVKLQVLRPIADTADVFDGDNCMSGSLKVTEQPNKRLTQVYTYFAKLNALVTEDQLNNYRSTSYSIDATAEAAYGTPVIKKIFSRWIPDGGRGVADTLGAVLLARFRDPPRRISFDVLRGSTTMPILGAGYQVGGWPFQDVDGAAIVIPAQATSINPRSDVFEVELEEISATSFPSLGSPGEHIIIIDANINNVNLRTLHDSLYGVPVSGNVVYCTINTGIIVGGGITLPAFDVGTWPGGITINLIVLGRIEGKGGNGGSGSNGNADAGAGGGGLMALKTTVAINLTDTNGQIWGGGGGGGGGGFSSLLQLGGGGGGGGAGKNPGGGGVGQGGGSPGHAGTTEVGGANSGGTIPGGPGGGPGLAGGAGANGNLRAGGAGGGAGKAINGIAFVTTIGAAGDRRGGTV